MSTGSSPFFINAGDTDDTITIEGEDGNAEIYIGKSALEGNLSHVSNLRVGPYIGVVRTNFNICKASYS